MKVRQILLPLAALTLVVACTPDPPPPPPPPPVAPTITTTSLPYALVGVPYSQTLTATGDTPITWSIDSGSLPTGLTLSPSGVISGTPTDLALLSNFLPFVVKATNSAGSDTQSLSIDSFQEATPGTFEEPAGTGAPLPEGAAIAFYHSPSVSGPGGPVFQYLADGSVKQVAAPLVLPSIVPVIRPNPQLATINNKFSRDLSLQTRRTPGLDQIELWGGPQVSAHTLLHTFPAIPGVINVSDAISPDGTMVAVYGDDGATTTFKIYETGAPYAELRSVTFPAPLGLLSLAVWDQDSSRVAVNVGAFFPGESEVKVIGAPNPALDEAPAAYDRCAAGAFGSGHRLLLTCLDPDFVFSVKTGTPDGSSSHMVYVSGASGLLFPVAASPSGTYIVILDDWQMAYLEDIPLNPMSPQVPVVLTTKIPGTGGPLDPPFSQDIGLEWSDTEWPRS